MQPIDKADRHSTITSFESESSEKFPDVLDIKKNVFYQSDSDEYKLTEQDKTKRKFEVQKNDDEGHGLGLNETSVSSLISEEFHNFKGNEEEKYILKNAFDNLYQNEIEFKNQVDSIVSNGGKLLFSNLDNRSDKSYAQIDNETISLNLSKF